MSKLSLGVEKAVLAPDKIDAHLERLGADVRGIRAFEELAEAAKRYATTHEERVAATVAKFKIARRGGRVLIEMATNGQRSDGGRPSKTTAKAAVVLKPTLDDMGISEGRSRRWQAVARMTEASAAQRIAAIEDLDPEADLAASVARDGGSGDFEWFTPPEIIEAARRVMGGIDLDPASSPAANAKVGAAVFFTKDDNGLEQNWAGRVWMNPPYAAKLVWAFCDKLAEDFANESVTQACVILNNTTETAWFQRLGEVSSALCLPARRVQFWHPDKPDAESPKQGQAVIYLGSEVHAFCVEFKAFGLTAAFV